MTATEQLDAIVRRNIRDDEFICERCVERVNQLCGTLWKHREPVADYDHECRPIRTAKLVEVLKELE